VPADEFRRFRDAEANIPAHSVMVNYYQPPESVPQTGIEVLFSDSGLLIGDGYFPLSTTGPRQVEGVRHAEGVPDALELSIGLAPSARTSSATIQSIRVLHVLRVPVAQGAGQAANAVVRRYPPRAHN
jgi:hypothetical protein